MKPSGLGIYIHFPYCVHHCVYCDFNVRELQAKAQLSDYLDALLREMEHVGRAFANDRIVNSVFIGGGTPSLYLAEQIERLLSALSQHFQVDRECEVTMEANPNSITVNKLKGYRQAGVNRLSLGVQSFNAHHLKTLERIHSPGQALNAIRAAQEVGFDSMNIDFIFGVPKQTLSDIEEDLDRAINLNLAHLSSYQLTVGADNPLYPALPGDGFSAEMYQRVIDILTARGYEHYEVSAFAKPGHACKHNLKYWQLDEFLGLGAGSYSRINTSQSPWGVHIKNVDNLSTYMGQVERCGRAIEEEERVSQRTAEKDYFVTNLRLLRGLSIDKFEERFNKNPMISYGKQISGLMERGLLDSREKMLKLSTQGLMYLNQVLQEFM